MERRVISLNTPQARRLAQLSAFAYDVDEAHDALQTAMSLHSDDPAQVKLRSYLITAGVVAYWRSFSKWRNKPTLEGHLKLSEESFATHEWARVWRNRVIAHSDSGMRRTLAFVILSKTGGAVSAEKSFALTMGVEMPDDRLQAFFALVCEVQAVLVRYKNSQAWRTSNSLSTRAIVLLWQKPESLGGLGQPELMRWDPSADKVEQEIAVTYPSNGDVSALPIDSANLLT